MNHNSFLAVISTTFPLNTRTKEGPQSKAGIKGNYVDKLELDSVLQQNI